MGKMQKKWIANARLAANPLAIHIMANCSGFITNGSAFGKFLSCFNLITKVAIVEKMRLSLNQDTAWLQLVQFVP